MVITFLMFLLLMVFLTINPYIIAHFSWECLEFMEGLWEIPTYVIFPIELGLETKCCGSTSKSKVHA
jgi:hypothetical protein